MTDGGAVFSLQGLCTEFVTSQGTVRAVDDVSFDLMPGETLGIVGESGSGKTATVLSALGLLPQDVGRVVAGSAYFGGRDLLKTPKRELRRLRGREIGVVFQDPMTSLNPVFSIGDQLVEAVRVHNPRVGKREARRRAVDALDLVGVPQAARRLDDYPHQYSGGMRQRVMIAMATINEPSMLIADEPTTALDVTIQAQVLEVLRAAREETGAASIMITHDLGVIAEMADRVAVMYAGRVVELAPAPALFARPQHPYTAGLLASIPSIESGADRLTPIPGEPINLLGVARGCAFRDRCSIGRQEASCAERTPALEPTGGSGHRAACHFPDRIATAPAQDAVTADHPRKAVDAHPTSPVTPGSEPTRADPEPAMEVRGLTKTFPVKTKPFAPRAQIKAVTDVSLSVQEGETLGLVGESGSGKTTVGRILVGLTDPTEGRISFRGRELASYRRGEEKELRRQLQIVFQDPYASLDPRMTVGAIVAEPFRIHGQRRRATNQQKVADLLTKVGLPKHFASRFPHQLSGGQRQRVGIARALSLEPRMIVLDEPVSALDVSVQAQVINLLQDLQRDLGLAYLFISHDLSVVHHIADRIAVMYLGKIVETGTREQIFSSAAHPYTQSLLSAIPVPDPTVKRSKRILLGGEIPNPMDPPSGCAFRTRCWKATDLCASTEPILHDPAGIGHDSACHYPEPGVDGALAEQEVSSHSKPT